MLERGRCPGTAITGIARRSLAILLRVGTVTSRRALAASRPQARRPTLILKATQNTPRQLPPCPLRREDTTPESVRPELSVEYDALTNREPVGGGNADITKATLPTPDGDVLQSRNHASLKRSIQTNSSRSLVKPKRGPIFTVMTTSSVSLTTGVNRVPMSLWSI